MAAPERPAWYVGRTWCVGQTLVKLRKWLAQGCSNRLFSWKRLWPKYSTLLFIPWGIATHIFLCRLLQKPHVGGTESLERFQNLDSITLWNSVTWPLASLPALLLRSPEDSCLYHTFWLPRHIRGDLQRRSNGDVALVWRSDGQCEAHGDQGGWSDLERPGNDVWRFSKCPKNCHQWQKVRGKVQRNTACILAISFTTNTQMWKQIHKTQFISKLIWVLLLFIL